MIIFTTRVPRISFSTAVALTSFATVAVLAFAVVKQPFEPVFSSDTEKLSTAQSKIQYLEDWGWEVVETPLATQNLLIPDTLDESYTDYIALQNAQGFPDLHQFTGETVQRFTYEVTNYPDKPQGIQVNILLYDKEVIAGEILSTEINGILHGLAMP